MTAVTRLARAKVNLSLRVVGRRSPDAPKAGYHELDSLIAFAEAGDSLTVRPADRLNLSLSGPFAAELSDEPDNLVLQAARALAERAGRPAGAEIALTKNLPVSSGIGGGSADAAATLDALTALWSLDRAVLDLAELGLRLGADVPVCLRDRSTLLRGIGEDLRTVASLPETWILLANPGRVLSTPSVFAAREGAFSAHLDPPPAGFASAQALATFVAEAGNDLTAAASRLCPAIPPLLRALESLEGALAAALSGSGATCFALFAEAAAAAAAADRARRDRLAPWFLVAPLARA
ncbi:MAG: 4-(cytidine 5'-diphospho)-2-C-methyl-D-erythritol kinase [Rhodospirillales bacterium]|nr:4-(cytidine 5'-diphospho)-2-C-methyl-D-erythritol kinase [Rhodospirillales bacterium]